MKTFDFKVGDKVYCYKTSDFVFMELPIHREGNTYEIKSVLELQDSNENSVISIILKSDIGFKNIENYYCYWIGDINSDVYKVSHITHSKFYLFEDYFLTNKQHRKLKIKKLK